MERLTEQETIDGGSIITHPNNCGVMTHCVCEKDIFWKIVNKLKEYEDLEEQGYLIRIPCKIGDTIYVIPSKPMYDINIVNGHEDRNRVYKQIVNGVAPSKRGYMIYTCDNQNLVLEEEYKKTWFLTEEEAEAALKGRE